MVSQVNINEAFTYLLVFLRVSGVIFLMPLFGDMQIPSVVKILLSGALALFFFSIFHVSPITFLELSSGEVLYFVLKETALGVIVGFTFRTAFFVVISSAETVAMASGFSMSRVFNPTVDASQTVIAELFTVLTILLFLSVGGDALLVRVLHLLFSQVPLGHLVLDERVVRALVGIGSTTLQMSVRMCGPILFCLLLVNLSMGIAGRIMPALNVMAMSFTITLGACLWLLWLFLPAYVQIVDSVFTSTEAFVLEIVRLLGGG